MNYAVASRTRFVDPIWVTLAMWTFVLVGAAWGDLNDLTPEFLLFMGLGIGAHVAGMAARRVTKARRARLGGPPLAPDALRRQWARGRLWSSVMLGILVTGLVFFLYQYSLVVPSLDPLGLVQMRNVYLEETRGERDKLFIYTTHLTLLGIATLYHAALNNALAVRIGQPHSRAQVNLIAVMTFCAGLLTTGRTAPLLVIICYAVYCLRFGLYTKRRIIGSFFVLSIAMFFLVALALGKEGLGDGDALESIGNLAKVYFFSAPAAMQEVVIHHVSVSDVCSNIFSYPVDLAKKFGFLERCDIRELDFVFVPVSTNVFTFLRAYWEDFGWGYPIALFAVGYLIEVIYSTAFAREGFCAFIYPIVLNALLLQIFEEQLFANGSVLSYLAVFYGLTHLLFVGRRRRGRRIPKPDVAATLSNKTLSSA